MVYRRSYQHSDERSKKRSEKKKNEKWESTKKGRGKINDKNFISETWSLGGKTTHQLPASSWIGRELKRFGFLAKTQKKMIGTIDGRSEDQSSRRFFWLADIKVVKKKTCIKKWFRHTHHPATCDMENALVRQQHFNVDEGRWGEKKQKKIKSDDD